MRGRRCQGGYASRPERIAADGAHPFGGAIPGELHARRAVDLGTGLGGESIGHLFLPQPRLFAVGWVVLRIATMLLVVLFAWKWNVSGIAAPISSVYGASCPRVY